ncbi:MAG: transketolase [Myxococcota bacterium]
MALKIGDRVGYKPVSPMTDLDSLAIDTIRTLSMDAVQAANSGHPGTPMALAPLGWSIFRRLRRHDPKSPTWFDRDRFVLSCGHASMLQYSLLHLSGYELSLEELRNFRQWDSLTPGHPEVFHTPGVETTTGPLGQGFANAVGMAIAERHLSQRFNRPDFSLIDHRTWVIASDGDVMEGVCAEAASLAGHLELGKLVVFWDDNSITIDGRTDLCFTEDTVARFASYGWHTENVDDGNDLASIERAAAAAIADPRPSFVRVKTLIGYPSPNKQDTSSAHGSPLGQDEIALTKQAMGWSHPAFHVPKELAEARDTIVAEGAKAKLAWERMRAEYQSAHPELASELTRVIASKLPSDWDQDLPKFEPDEKGLATRKASGAVIAELSERIPELLGGSADLAGSNNSYQKGKADLRAEGSEPARNIHFGIREHAMASGLNGMALHGGVVPYGATFLVFSDYMRPGIRLAALMGVPTRYIFTHDSIGLGEDGPTHQPIEHLAALRAIPGLTVLRPGDANEVVEAWRVFLQRRGPAALVLTRQGVPTLDRSKVNAAEGARRGAYVLSDAENAKVILIGTGSEIHVALAGQALLREEGIAARVVSMPSWEVFEEQDREYRDAVLPATIPARVVVEAGVRLGWERYVGTHGGFVTLERFGASAPAKTLYERLGITAGAVAAEAKRLLS